MAWLLLAIVLIGILFFVYATWVQSKYSSNMSYAYLNHPIIDEIKNFKIDQDFLDDVNAQRLIFGYEPLGLEDAKRISTDRANCSVVSIIMDTPDQKLSSVKRPFEYLVYYKTK